LEPRSIQLKALDARLKLGEAFGDGGIGALQPRTNRLECCGGSEAPRSATTIDAADDGDAVALLEPEQPASRLPRADAARRGDVLREQAPALSKRTAWALDAPRTNRRRRDAVPLTMAAQMYELSFERSQSVRYVASGYTSVAAVDRLAADPALLAHLRSSRIRARA
jgi:hypothetical protein